MKSQNWVIFTDLDGSLLDHHNYSFEAAAPALEVLRSRNIPWLLNTSKTFSELEQLRLELKNPWPLIVENGSGVAVPDTPESNELFGLANSSLGFERRADYRFYSLGRLCSEFLPQIEPLRRKYNFLSYQDMTPEKLMELTGLGMQEALQSLDRQYTEPCIWTDSEAAYLDFVAELKEMDLCCVRGGRFAHIMGKSDKGSALKWVMESFFSRGKFTSVALGDGENDLPMLNSADIAILVRSPVHQLPGPCVAAQTIVTDEPGPAGWAGAIIALLNESTEPKQRV